LKNIDEKLYQSLQLLAKQERRSISQEVVFILENYLSKRQIFENIATDEFLNLAGSWDDERTAEEIIADIRQSRMVLS